MNDAIINPPEVADGQPDGDLGRLMLRRSYSVSVCKAMLPLISILGVIWLWRDTGDPVRMAEHAQATFWYVLPSLPMFLLIPVLLRQGMEFWPALLLGCVLTIGLYGLTMLASGRLGLRL